MAIKGYWKFNGNSNDYSGNGKNGTDTGVSYTRPFLSGQSAAYLTGATSKIAFPNVGISGSQARTVSIWFYPTVVNSTLNILYYQGSQALGRVFAIFLNGSLAGDIYIHHYGDGADFKTAGSLVQANKWNHILVTYDGSTILSTTSLSVWLNGIKRTITKIGTSNVTANVADSNYSIGFDGVSAYYRPLGNIDEIKSCNTKFSNAEIKNELSRIKGFF